MVVAADDVGDAHVVVVDHDREHVGRRAVRAQQHEIVEVLVLPDHAPLHLILDRGLARERRLEPDRGLRTGRRVAGIAIAPAPIIKLCAPFFARLLSHLGKLIRGRIATVRMPGRQQSLDHRAVTVDTGELIDGLAVPIEAEPGQSVENGVDRRRGRALAVGILDPQQHLAAVAASIEPIEQRSARPTDMEKSGGRRSEAGDDGVGHVEEYRARFMTVPLSQK